MSIFSTGNYITNIEPQRFGGQQTNYVKQGETVIQKGVKLAKTALRENGDLKALFLTIFDLFAKTRHDLAVAHKTSNAHEFGRRRMDFTGVHSTLALQGQYDAFNPKITEKMQEMLKGSIPLKGEPSKKRFLKIENCLKRQCSFEIEVFFEQADLLKKNLVQSIYPFANEEEREMAKKINNTVNIIQKVDIANFPPTSEERLVLEQYNNTILKTKTDFPNFYTYYVMSDCLKKMMKCFPSPLVTRIEENDIILGNKYFRKNILLLATTKIFIKNKMVPLTQFWTWTYQTHVDDPVERMKHSKILMIQQDRFLIDETMQEIAIIFEKALRWDKKSGLQNLKDEVSLIRYLFAHTMPTIRGSAAIGEWLEKCIYETHDIKCTHVEKTMGDMEAFVSCLWSTFHDKLYDTTIQLSDMEGSSVVANHDENDEKTGMNSISLGQK